MKKRILQAEGCGLRDLSKTSCHKSILGERANGRGSEEMGRK